MAMGLTPGTHLKIFKKDLKDGIFGTIFNLKK